MQIIDTWQIAYASLQPVDKVWALEYIIMKSLEIEELLQDEEYEDIFHSIIECESGATDQAYFNIEKMLRNYAFRKGIDEQELTPRAVVIAYFYHDTEMQIWGNYKSEGKVGLLLQRGYKEKDL